MTTSSKHTVPRAVIFLAFAVPAAICAAGPMLFSHSIIDAIINDDVAKPVATVSCTKDFDAVMQPATQSSKVKFKRLLQDSPCVAVRVHAVDALAALDEKKILGNTLIVQQYTEVKLEALRQIAAHDWADDIDIRDRVTNAAMGDSSPRVRSAAKKLIPDTTNMSFLVKASPGLQAYSKHDL